jgi:hypothetical protein
MLHFSHYKIQKGNQKLSSLFFNRIAISNSRAIIMTDYIHELQLFTENWEETPDQIKKVFIHLKDFIVSKADVTLDFVSRQGITYSLRASHKDKNEKPFFILVDVIEDQPRWLSVCFYSHMITDADKKGVFIPHGILGDDAICFDVEKYNEALIKYLEVLIDEAYQNFAGCYVA